MMLLHQLCKIRGRDFGYLVQQFNNRLDMHMDAESVDQIEYDQSYFFRAYRNESVLVI